MIIDTTKHISRYEKIFREIYFKNYLSLRIKFCEWIDDIGFKNNLDWWISIPASRNANYSNLFHYFCVIESIKEVKKKVKIEKIIVSSNDFANLIKKNLKLKVTIIVKTKSVFFLLENFFIIFKNLTFYTIIYLFSKLGLKKKISDKKKLVLIDTFVSDSDLNKNRYYGKNLISIINKEDNIFFVPTLYMGMGLLKALKIIYFSKKNKNYLLREDYLTFGDIIKSYLLIYRRKNLIKTYAKLNKIDFSKFIKKEINLNDNLASQILAWQNFFFFKNLKKSEIKLTKIINWFENQSLDKGWNYGSRTFYPNATSYGYQGFAFFPQYMNMIPTQGEYNSKIVPDTILSIEKIYNKVKKEFCKKIKIKTAPALNHTYLYDKINKKKFKENKNILIVLCGYLEVDINLIMWVIKSNIHKKEFKIIIQEHPTLKFDLLKENIKIIPKEFEVSTKNFNDSVNNSQFLICSAATTATIQLIIQGKFCIIPQLNPFDEITFKRLKISNNYKVIANPLKLSKFILKQKTIKYHKKFFFTKLTKKNIKLFL